MLRHAGAKRAVGHGQAIANGSRLAKDLANLPGNLCTPTHLASQAQGLARGKRKLKVTVLSEAQMKKLGMGSLAFDPNTLFEIEKVMAIPSGIIVMSGPTGSGKSTLISLLLRFYDPQQGTIRIDDCPIEELSLRDLRTIVGVVLQDVFILDDTLLRNIVMDSGQSRQHVENILENSGMTPFIDKLEQGLDTRIGDGGRELSTGEKQLLAFARALCRNPAVLILDEATAFIDSETESILEDAIDRLENRTSIIIAHRLSTIKRADRIVVMKDGAIVEQGTHETLLKRGAHYARLVELDTFGSAEISPVPELVPE